MVSEGFMLLTFAIKSLAWYLVEYGLGSLGVEGLGFKAEGLGV